MKILVTGGAGFIGSHVADGYIEEGYDVVIVDNLSTGKLDNLNPKAKFYKVDIRDFDRITKIFKKEKPDIVNHHAAHNNFLSSFENPVFDLDVNAVGTLNVIKASIETDVRKIIYASSGGLTYGDKAKLPIKETSPLNPLGPYAISKLMGEYYLQVFSRKYGIKYTILRYGNVYGPRQDINGEVGIVAILIGKVLKNENPIIRGSGKQTRDFVYVKDVVDVNKIVLKGGDNEIFNIGTGKETSIVEVFEIIKKIAKRPNLKLFHTSPIEGDERRFCLDITKAKKILGWRPRYKLEEGIRETIEYWKQRL